MKKLIFNDEVFDVNYIPLKKLPARQELVDEICSKIERSNNYKLFLGGITGTGKTISVEKASAKLGSSLVYIYINCSETNTYTSIAKRILEIIKRKPYSEKGKNRSEFSEDLKRSLSTKREKKLLFVFDEIDKLIFKKENHWEIFFPLLNYGNASFILISNEVGILEKIDPRIISRLSPEKKFLDVYNPDEIYQILKQRAELGLRKGSFDSGILIKIAKFSSEVSGDIRFAIKLLEKSAVSADLAGKKVISDEELEKAIKETQISDIEKLFPTLPKHLKIVIVALCLEAQKNCGLAITYPNSYKTYVFHAKNQQFGVVGERQFRDYMTSLEMLGLFDFQWRSADSRRGRVRVAIPKFDSLKFLDMIYGNNGGEEGGG